MGNSLKIGILKIRMNNKVVPVVNGALYLSSRNKIINDAIEVISFCIVEL